MIGKQSLVRNEVGRWNDEKLVTVEKLMMLHLLLNEKDRNTTLLSLCDLLVLSRKTTTHKDLTGLLNIVRNCIAGNAVKNLGFSKINLENVMFSHLYCLALIQNVTFVEQPQDGPALLYEGKGIRRAATLYEPVSGRRIEVWTDQSGLQFYSGNFFDGSYAGKGGQTIGHRCALALETQAWPDAIHHPAFPNTVLRPGETYTHTCIYKFGVSL